MSVTTTKPPTTSPAMVPASSVVPFPMSMGWGGGGVPGCCPPGGLDALMKCYCDIQQTLQFMSKIMVDLMTNDPAVQAAMIAGIQNSGSNVPLLGVTNGSNAQPGQVGEFIHMETNQSYPTAAQTVPVTMGVLQPGDWDVWVGVNFSTFVADAQAYLNPLPPGFTNNLEAIVAPITGIAAVALWGGPIQASISVPTLVVFSLTTNNTVAGPSAGTAYVSFYARRAR